MTENWGRKIKKTVIFLIISFLFPSLSVAGIPEVNNVMVTDVTTVSFSVIWEANEAATCDLEVFEDENGTLPVTEAIITPHPVESGDLSIVATAEDNGVMKVRVTGLEADTTYYFQTITTSKSTTETSYYPSSAPFSPVTTQINTVRSISSAQDEVPFSNDVIIETCYLDDGVTPAEGTLLLATFEDGSYPLTAFVGDGVELPYALIDLNNAFNRETGENLDLEQGKNLTLLNFRGIEGYSIVTHEVPQDNLLCEVKPGKPGLKIGWNMVSLPLEPNNPAIENIIVQLGDKVSSIWAFDANNNMYRSWDPLLGEWSDLDELHSIEGYWFVMSDEASLYINGEFSAGTTQLYPGWNLVGSKSIKTKSIEEALAEAGINGLVQSVWYYNAAEQIYYSYDPMFPEWSDLQYLEPGKSYWFVMSSSCSGTGCQW